MTRSAGTSFVPFGAPQLFRATALIIFVTGTVLHSLRLALGSERLSTEYLTPLIDGAFGLLMLISAVAGWLSLRRFAGSLAVRAGFIFALMLITLSIPIHLRALMVWSTEYITIAPPWYSAVEIPLFLGLAYLVTRLRLR